MDSTNTLHLSYQNLAKAGLNSLSNSAISSGIYGTNFKDNFISNLAFNFSDSLYKAVGDYSNNEFNLNSNKYFKDGSVGKITLHSLTGASVSALTNNDILAGALSAGVNEALSPLFYKDASKLVGTPEEIAKQKEIYNIQRNSLSSLIGTISGALVDGESGAGIGSSIAISADRNNRALHQEEIDFINTYAKEYAKQENISENEAKMLLITSAMIYNDAFTAYGYDKFSGKTLFNKEQIARAQEYLWINGKNLTLFDKTTNSYQRAFYSTPYQYLKNDYKLSEKYITNNDYNSKLEKHYDERFLMNSLKKNEVENLGIIANETNGWVKMSKEQSKYHMYGYLGDKNEKYVNNDGREVVLRQMDSGEYIIINDYKNIGTYNFQNPVPINRILD